MEQRDLPPHRLASRAFQRPLPCGSAFSQTQRRRLVTPARCRASTALQLKQTSKETPRGGKQHRKLIDSKCPH